MYDKYIMKEEDEFPVKKTEEEWKEILNEEQYEIMREGDTEIPFTGDYLKIKGEGIFHCAGCETELFDIKNKFDLGSGWLSFTTPIDMVSIVTKPVVWEDSDKTGVFCAQCGGQLGIFFEEEGPHEGEDRYSIYSCVLKFEGTIIEEKEEPKKVQKQKVQQKNETKKGKGKKRRRRSRSRKKK